MSCRGEERELGGGSASETEALNAGAGEAVEEARQSHDKSHPCAAAVVAVRNGEAEARSPGRRPGSWGTLGGGQRGSFLPGQEGLAGSLGKDLKSPEDH